MTNKQYTRYKAIEEEISPIKRFLKGCQPSLSPWLILTIMKPKLKIKRRKVYWSDVHEIEVPDELRERIVKVIEGYVDEKENEQKKL